MNDDFNVFFSKVMFPCEWVHLYGAWYKSKQAVALQKHPHLLQDYDCIHTNSNKVTHCVTFIYFGVKQFVHFFTNVCKLEICLTRA